MRRTNKERIGSVVQRELSKAEGGTSDETSANRKQALEYYFANPRGDEVKGRSSVISTDVADMTNAVLALLVPMISTDAVIAFEPMGEGDDASAAMESHALNDLVIDDNEGFMSIQTAVKDALLQRVGILKVRVDETQSVQKMDVAGAPAEALALMALEAPANVGITRDGDVLTIVRTTRRFVISAVPPENICWQSGYSGRLQDIRFFAERVPYTRSDLVEMGVDRKIVDDLPSYDDSDMETAHQRDPDGYDDDEAETSDQEVIWCTEAYLLIDLDGDGVSERYQCLTVGNQCLTYEPADVIPYALGSAFLSPHRLGGESLFDHLKATQDTKTALRRQLLDNVTTNNNGRFIYDPSQANEHDILNPTAGGGIRARNPQGSVVPLVVPDMTPGILSGLQYEDQVRSERGGAALEMTSGDAQVVGETAHGIERQYASREALVSMFAKNLAEGMIRNIYLLTHGLMRRHANEPVSVRIAGQHAQVDPSSWPERTRLNVTVGMTPGQRGHLQQTLLTSLQLQASAMQSGMNGVLASPQTIYRTHQMWLGLAGVENPERLGIDPDSPQAQQALQAAQAAAAKEREHQETMVRLQMQLEQAKLAEEARQADEEMRFKYYDANLDADVAEAKIAGQGVIDLEKQRVSHERAADEGIGSGAASSGGDRR